MPMPGVGAGVDGALARGVTFAALSVAFRVTIEDLRADTLGAS